MTASPGLHGPVKGIVSEIGISMREEYFARGIRDENTLGGENRRGDRSGRRIGRLLGGKGFDGGNQHGEQKEGREEFWGFRPATSDGKASFAKTSQFHCVGRAVEGGKVQLKSIQDAENEVEGLWERLRND